MTSMTPAMDAFEKQRAIFEEQARQSRADGKDPLEIDFTAAMTIAALRVVAEMSDRGLKMSEVAEAATAGVGNMVASIAYSLANDPTPDNVLTIAGIILTKAMVAMPDVVARGGEPTPIEQSGHA